MPGFFGDAASANFADWPFRYDDLEPFYVEAERLIGVSGDDSNPFAPPRSAPYPMPAHEDMYLAHILRDGRGRTTLPRRTALPHKYPAAIASRFYDEDDPELTPAALQPVRAVQRLRLSDPRQGLAGGHDAAPRVADRPVPAALQLPGHPSAQRRRHVTGVEYVDGDGTPQTAVADAYVLAASAIESARLCLLSPTPGGGALGNSSGQVGQNLMFHFQTNVNGFFPRRVHGQRGMAVTSGLADFRGVEPGGAEVRVVDTPLGPRAYLGGVCEFSASQGLPITEDGDVYAFQLPLLALRTAAQERAARPADRAASLRAADAGRGRAAAVELRHARPDGARRLRTAGAPRHLQEPCVRAGGAALLPADHEGRSSPTPAPIASSPRRAIRCSATRRRRGT